jgi:hypothetical protein
VTETTNVDNATHRLLWRDQLVATVTDVALWDFPWLCGKFMLAPVAVEIRQLLEWMDHWSKTKDDLTDDPPFPSQLLRDWYMEEPDGSKTEIMIPVLDFADHTITWR